jgi:hypothetical protein
MRLSMSLWAAFLNLGPERMAYAMVARNKLLTAPPCAVEQALKRLGAKRRTARLPRRATCG